MAKKVSFSSRASLNFISSPFSDQKKIKKEIEFFNQKHGLTPLEKCHFWDSKKKIFLNSQKKFLCPVQSY